MKMIKKLLLAGLIFSATSACAMDEVNTNDEKFDALIQEVMNSNSPSTLKRAGVETLREVVKYGGVFVAFLVAVWCDTEKNEDFCPPFKGLEMPKLGILLFALMAAIPLLSDHFIGTNDRLLTSLKSLEKYVSELSPEKRSDLINLFKDKYEKDLNNKVLEQQDSLTVKVGKGAVLAIDLIIPTSIWLLMNEGAFNMPKLKETFTKLTNRDIWKDFTCPRAGVITNTSYAAILLIFLINLPQVILNFYKNPNLEKSRALAKIQKALAQ